MQINPEWFGACPAPFYDVTLEPFQNPHVNRQARTCLGNCCFPCPLLTQFIYTPWTLRVFQIASILCILSFIFAFFILISYAVLAREYTGSTFDKISIIVAVSMINLAMIIPYGVHSSREPEIASVVCADPATPNDMGTSNSCAFSGLAFIFGSISLAVWYCIVCTLLFVNITWKKVPGAIWTPAIRLIGWVLPLGITAIAMSVTGVSYRLGGGPCQINHAHAIETYWTWLLFAICSAGFILYLTYAVIIIRYFTSLWRSGSFWRSSRTTYGDEDPQSPYALRRELKHSLVSNWRLILIVHVMLVMVFSYVTVFFHMDSNSNSSNPLAKPFNACLMKYPFDREKCYGAGQHLLVSEVTFNGVVFMLSTIGMVTCAAVCRKSFFVGWKILILDLVGHGQQSAGSQNGNQEKLRSMQRRHTFDVERNAFYNDNCSKSTPVLGHTRNPTAQPLLADCLEDRPDSNQT